MTKIVQKWHNVLEILKKWIHSYFGNVITKFMISNRTDGIENRKQFVDVQYLRFWRSSFGFSLLRACFQSSLTGSMGFLLQPVPWQRQVFVPFRTVAWHSELYWEELENGGRRKQLVNITTLLFFQRHVARQRSVLLLQSFVRRQLLLQTPVDLLQCANDSRQDAHDRLHCVCVISVNMRILS